MPASRFAAIAALEMVFFGENPETFGREVIIFAFGQFIFVILIVHCAKLNFLRHVCDRFEIFGAERFWRHYRVSVHFLAE